jgi:putative Mg2+ transporter-C (MgtC) family protein
MKLFFQNHRYNRNKQLLRKRGLRNMVFSMEDLIKLVVAVLIGGVIGVERERHNKAAGLRTMILICVGSTLFTIIPTKFSGANFVPSQIIANIVSGIGFLGAGVILREGGRITGLTTAASIWLSAALGMGIGGSQYLLVIAATLIVTIVLWVFPRFEDRLSIPTEVRTYTIVCINSWSKFKELKALFKEQGMAINSYRQGKRGEDMVCTFEVYGTTKKHDHVVQKLLADKEVKETSF